MSTDAAFIYDSESRSSLFEKLPADLRRRLDQAIIDREPAAYRAAYAKFHLARHGVSLTAVDDNARRIRVQADMLRLAELAQPGAPDLATALPELMAYRLLEAANDESTTPGTLHRLVDAWRIAVSTQVTLQRQAAIRRQVQELASAAQGGGLKRIGKCRRARKNSAAEPTPTNLERSGLSTPAPKSAARAATGRNAENEGTNHFLKVAKQHLGAAEVDGKADEAGRNGRRKVRARAGSRSATRDHRMSTWRLTR